jgi:hypothetical protein
MFSRAVFFALSTSAVNLEKRKLTEFEDNNSGEVGTKRKLNGGSESDDDKRLKEFKEIMKSCTRNNENITRRAAEFLNDNEVVYDNLDRSTIKEVLEKATREALSKIRSDTNPGDENDFLLIDNPVFKCLCSADDCRWTLQS